jgi:predicted porin
MKFKQHFLAMAAVMACGSAMAQSSVTMYGILDVSLGKTTGGSFGLNGGKSATSPAQSYHTPTRIGFRGTEDLGDGLKAHFNFESGGLRLGDGGPGLDFSREAWAGLSGNFGSTRFGRTSSFGTQGHARFDLNGISTSSAMDNAGISPVTWYGSSRRSSQLQYVTPSFSGFDAGVALVLGGNNEGQRSVQVRANYGNGPLAVGYVAETKRVAGNRTARAVAGSYDFGVAKVVGGYVVRETEAAGKGVYVGAVAPVGAVIKVGVQHARNTETDVNATELFANYALSKRTSLYVDYVKRNGDDRTSYALGLLHAF